MELLPAVRALRLGLIAEEFHFFPACGAAPQDDLGLYEILDPRTIFNGHYKPLATISSGMPV